jgi:hypothetical protein
MSRIVDKTSFQRPKLLRSSDESSGALSVEPTLLHTSIAVATCPVPAYLSRNLEPSPNQI